jgi:hypothetical protein
MRVEFLKSKHNRFFHSISEDPVFRTRYLLHFKIYFRYQVLTAAQNSEILKKKPNSTGLVLRYKIP